VDRYIEMAGERFSLFARAISTFSASVLATALAFITILAWAVSGPYFHFSANWQVTIGTGTSIVTFLMVFILNKAQSRDTTAINAKLDAVIIAIEGADNRMIGLERQTDVQAHAVHENVLLQVEPEIRIVSG